MDLKYETLVSYSSIAHPRERIVKVVAVEGHLQSTNLLIRSSVQKLCMFYSGGRVGIYFGDFKDLSRDLPILQPTIMVCVPRILNRLYHRVS